MITKIKQWLKADNDIWSLRLFKLAFMLLFTLMFLCFCGYDKEHPVFLFFYRNIHIGYVHLISNNLDSVQ